MVLIKWPVERYVNCLLYSIIFTNQIEARTFNKTYDLEKNQKYDIFTTPVNKRLDMTNNTDRNDTELMKQIYNHIDQQSYTNAESDIISRKNYNHKCKHEHNDSDKSQEEQQGDNILRSNTTITSNKIELTLLDNKKHFSNEGSCTEDTSDVNLKNSKPVAEAQAQTIAIERVKQEDETKLETNEESSLQNDVAKENYQTVKNHFTVRHRNTMIRTTQATSQIQLIPKKTHKRNTNTVNEMCETEHCDYKNHRSKENILQEHDVYESKHRDEFKTPSKHNNHKNVNKNMNIKHPDTKSHKTFKETSQENIEYKLKHRDVEKTVLPNKISMDNYIYIREHNDDSATVEKTFSKVKNKKKVNKNNMKIKHRDNESHKSLKKSSQGNGEYRLKHRDIEKPIQVITISMENDISVLKHNDDSAIEEEPISKLNTKMKVNKNHKKIKHRDNKNHKTLKKPSQKNSEYKLKHRDIEKPLHVNTMSMENDISNLKHSDDSAIVEEPISKHYNKKKVNKNNMKTKHRKKINKTFKTIPQHNSKHKLKRRDITKPIVSNTISMENDVYVQKHINDFTTTDEPDSEIYEGKYTDDSAAEEEQVSKQVNPENTPKVSHNYQKKRKRDKKIRKIRNIDKTKHKSKTKHNSKKVIWKQKKLTLNENSDSVSETHTDDADTTTLENQDEKETLDTYEKLLKENDLQNKPRLPFYVSSTTKQVINEIFEKQPQKLGLREDEKVRDRLIEDLTTFLKGKSDLRNQDIDLNTTMSRLASTKILDFITDRVAGQMLKKLEKSLAPKNNLRMKEVATEKVEQIGILFKQDGDMVMMDPGQNKQENEYGIREVFYPE